MFNNESVFNSDDLISVYTREDAISDGVLDCFTEWVEINFPKIKTDSFCLSEVLVKRLCLETVNWEAVMRRLVKNFIKVVMLNEHDTTSIKFNFKYIDQNNAIQEVEIQGHTSVELFSMMDKKESKCMTFGLQGDF